MKTMRYKGFYGSVDASMEDACLYGKLEFIDDLVNYEGLTVQELVTAFREAVDDYLDTCHELGKEPQKSCLGSFNVQVGPQLHWFAVVAARQKNIDFNEFVKIAMEHELDDRHKQGSA